MARKETTLQPEAAAFREEIFRRFEHFATVFETSAVGLAEAADAHRKIPALLRDGRRSTRTPSQLLDAFLRVCAPGHTDGELAAIGAERELNHFLAAFSSADLTERGRQ